MTRNLLAQSAATIAILASVALTPILAQQPKVAGSTQPVAAQPTTTVALAKLEIAMSQADPDSKEFGMAVADYWKLITESNDGSRVYDFFRALTAERKTPSATLLAYRASAACYYMGWLA
jgi:hypothetical protein